MLEICSKYFEHLNEKGIRYCHWKSNEHLTEALNGKTDLDVLVHPDDQEIFEASLCDFPFKEILSQPSKRFPGLKDYLGFDEATGKFIHLHVHYRLILGQKYIKNHWLPIEDLFFDNLTSRDGVKIPRPELELILLVIRAHMKTDMQSLLKHAIKDCFSGHYTAFPHDIEMEFKHLIATSELEVVKDLLKKSELPLSMDVLVEFFDRMKSDSLKFHHILKVQIYILKSLKQYRRATGLMVYISYCLFFVKALPVISKLQAHQKKTLINKGKFFSIVGADGSGKSTLSDELTSWLSWKLTTTKYYYGIPKSGISKLFDLSIRILGKLKFKQASDNAEALFWIYVAKQRQKVSSATKQDQASGRIALTDRFSLKAFQSMEEPMDGPRLQKSPNKVRQGLVLKEQQIYNSLNYPDKIFVLQVEIDELRRRKTDLPLETHVIKAKAVNSIKEGDGNIVTIDANRPYEDVLLDIKRGIWSEL